MPKIYVELTNTIKNIKKEHQLSPFYFMSIKSKYILYNNYQQFMKSTIFLVLVAVLVIQSCQAKPNQLAVVGPLSAVAFGCLKAQGYGFSIIRVYQISVSPAPGAVDSNATKTLINSAAAQLPADAYMVICRNSDPVSQVAAIFNGINKSLFDYLWIKVQPNTTPGCLWQGYSRDDNCDFIKAAIAKAGTYIPARQVGIFSTANIWGKYFDNTCNIGAPTKLWYAEYDKDSHVDSGLSFDDFKPFGGWTKPFIKQVGGKVNVTPLCGNSKWHARIDQLWWQ